MKHKQKKTQAKVVVPKLPKIKDYLDTSNLGIMLVSHRAMQEIYSNSGKLARSNEFQVHYWFLNFRFTASDNSIIDVAIPTVYYNYAQTVSSATIDFDLKDVIAMSKAVEPVHNMLCTQILESGIQSKIEDIIGSKVEAISMDYGSIHKHPGSSKHQSFSGTDLAKEADEPGVVYPLKDATLTPNFAGIMALDSNTCNIARYEYRIATGTLGEDIEYDNGMCATFVADEKHYPSEVEKLVGKLPTQDSYELYDNMKENTFTDKFKLIAEELLTVFSPMTKFINPDNLDEKITHVIKTVGNTYNREHLGEYIIKDKSELKSKSVYELNRLRKILSYKVKNTIISSYMTSKDVLLESVMKLHDEYMDNIEDIKLEEEYYELLGQGYGAY